MRNRRAVCDATFRSDTSGLISTNPLAIEPGGRTVAGAVTDFICISTVDKAHPRRFANSCGVSPVAKCSFKIACHCSALRRVRFGAVWVFVFSMPPPSYFYGPLSRRGWSGAYERGRFFGAAISAARPTAIDDLLAITKTSRFLTSGVLLDATLEIAEVTALESPTYPQSSLDAAGNLVCAYITATDADKTIHRDGKVLAEIINTVAGKKTSDLRLRGALFGIYISGAYKFSVAVTKRDEESVKRYKQFNGLLWDSLNSITFPGVAAVTAILKTASEELISKAFVPRDFRSQLVQRLGAIKWAIEKDFEKSIKTDDIIEGERFLNGRVMEWIDIAMACNGVL